MRIRGKKAFVVVLLVSIVAASVSIQVTNTNSIEPFFTLVAKGFNSRHMDYLNLMKQQLDRIGIHLDIQLFDWDEVKFLGFLVILRDMDLMIMDIYDFWELDPFLSDFFAENGSMNFIGYRTEADWDEELGTGRNEWYIDNGLQMISNDSQEQINHCWEWQHYIMNELLPCLPLFAHKNNHSSYELLFYNVHEIRPIIGRYDPSPLLSEISQGLAIRKAISYAINREEIRRVVLGDDYKVIHHPTNPNQTDWLNLNSIRYCYNLAVARNFMYVSGYSMCLHDFEGYDAWPDWENVCNGNPTSVNIIGYDFFITLGVLSITTFSWIIYQLRKRRKIVN